MLLHLAADGPVQIFREAALLERQIAEAEQIQRLIERLLRIVIALQQIARGDRAVGLLQIDQRLLGLGGQLLRDIFVAQSRTRPER